MIVICKLVTGYLLKIARHKLFLAIVLNRLLLQNKALQSVFKQTDRNFIEDRLPYGEGPTDAKAQCLGEVNATILR
jgi:hypothetical protein